MESYIATIFLFSLVLVVNSNHSDDGLLEMHGSGTTNPSKFFWKVMELLEDRARQPIHLTYRSVGSGTGIYEFIGEDNNDEPYNDFGSGDIPLKKADYPSMVGDDKMIHVPFILGAISFFHSIPGVASGSLKMTPCLLSKIFQCIITTWDHPAITTLNPDLVVPSGQEIKVVRRIHGSSSTSLMSQYLSEVCTDPQWDIGVGKGGEGKYPSWRNCTTGKQGSEGVSQFISRNPWGIGYLDSGHGHKLNLAEILLENKNGVFLTSKEADISSAATSINLPEATGNWDNVSLIDQPGSTTWPITTWSYLYIRQNLTKLGESGALVKAFAEFVLKEGQTFVCDFGFVKVPDNVVALGLNALKNNLTLNQHVESWIFEEPDNTQKAIGAGRRVFSGKRQSYGAYSREHQQIAMDEMKKTVTRLEESSLLEMHGSGTTNPSKLFWMVMNLLEDRARQPIHLSYRAVGSGTGIDEFVGKDNEGDAYNHFGSGDIPLSTEDFQDLGNNKMVHVPFILGAISFFHNIPGVTMGFPNGLNLTSCLLSSIFQCNITNWDHDDIKSINPNMNVPPNQPIHVARRVHGSSSTSLTSQYLNLCTDPSWEIGVGKGGVGKAPNWKSCAKPLQGSDGVANFLAENEYSIGYLDSDHGHKSGLKEICLRNKAGTFLDSKTADIGSAASTVSLPDPEESWAHISLLNRDGNKTWPITTWSYIYVRQDLTQTGEAGALVKAFVQFLLSDEGQSYVSDFGFDPIPQSVIDLGNTALAKLQLSPDVEEWTFELPGETQKGKGSGDRVFSGKKQGYHYWLSKQQTVLLEMFATKVVALENKIAEMNALDLNEEAILSYVDIVSVSVFCWFSLSSLFSVIILIGFYMDLICVPLCFAGSVSRHSVKGEPSENVEIQTQQSSEGVEKKTEVEQAQQPPKTVEIHTQPDEFGSMQTQQLA